MKKCLICNQTYTDDSLNFCLNDGGTLEKMSDDAPPTIFMNQPRTTSESNWANSSPFDPPNQQPISPWQQNQPANQNPMFMSSAMPFQAQDKTLPTVALVLGILGMVFFCCYGGIPFGLGAMITGFLGYNNANKNPSQYGGRGLAIAGMVLGAISFIGIILLVMLGLMGNLLK